MLNAPLSAKHKEDHKTDAERAEDISYTINHAIACTATDIISPFIGNFTQNYLGKRITIGCNHDHTPSSSTPVFAAGRVEKSGKGLFRVLKDAEEKHSIGGYKRLHTIHTCEHGLPVAQSKNNLKHWWIGELAGDFGAVPVTIAVQRFVPGFMNAIRTLAEPFAAPLFKIGARRSTRIWAEENHIASDTAEYKAHEKEVFEHEMSHLPQAFMWTASSTVLNLAAQRLSGNKGELSHLIAGKLAGSITSASLVLGFRGIAPHQAYRLDRFTSEHIFEPVTRAVTGRPSSWQEKVNAASDATQQRF